MEMEKAPEKQILFSPRFFKPSSLCAAVLVPFLFFVGYLAFGCSSYLVTIAILFFSTIFIITLSKKKVVVVENPGQDGIPTCRSASALEEEVGEKIKPEVHNGAHCEAAIEGCLMHEYQVEPTDFLYDSESSSDFLASESFEHTWKCSDNLGHNITISESSDDEEDGDDLIEISLPTNNSGAVNEEQKQKLTSDLPDYLPESIYRQEGLMELLAELNESNDEENLIEIDLSMNSIKFSRFDIEG